MRGLLSRDIQWVHFPYGAEHYLKTKETLSDSGLDDLRSLDAILLGAIGHPDLPSGLLEREILLRIRFELDQYVNLRPVKLYPSVDSPLKNIQAEQIDYVIVRENTGGMYTGMGGVSSPGSSSELAIQNMVYTRSQLERITQFSFEMAQSRHKDQPWKGLSQKQIDDGYRSQVTLCGKSNVLSYVF